MELSRPDFINTPELVQQFDDIADRLVRTGTVLDDSDCHAIGVLARNMLAFIEHSTLLDQEGVMIQVDGNRGRPITKKNPRADHVKDIQSNLRFYFNQLGMTPKSKSGRAAETEVGEGFSEFLQ